MKLNTENFERTIELATDDGVSSCKIAELRSYLDTIIDSCRLSFRDTLDIDSDILTTILKTYSKSSVNEKIKELKAEREEMLAYTLDGKIAESEEDKDAE